MKWLLSTNKQAAIGLLLFRVVLGGFMLVHGLQKLNGYEQMADRFPDPIGLGSQLSLILAIAAEFGCSVLLIAGAFTRIALIPLAFTMIVACFIVHANDGWQKQELAAFYLAGYVALFVSGPGLLSVDHVLFGKANTMLREQQT